MGNEERSRTDSDTVAIAHLQKDVGSLQRHDLKRGQDIEGLKSAVSEHRIRLENGTHVFQKFDERISIVEDLTKPKPVSITKIASISFVIFMAAAGALWALHGMLRDRPTVEQLDKVLDVHEENGHKAVREDVRAIGSEQAKQRTLIESVAKEQGKQAEKLDTVLDRLPPRKRRR